jgi:hypothetical protein
MRGVFRGPSECSKVPEFVIKIGSLLGGDLVSGRWNGSLFSVDWQPELGCALRLNGLRLALECLIRFNRGCC